jgi:hypothetical protein
MYRGRGERYSSVAKRVEGSLSASAALVLDKVEVGREVERWMRIREIVM